MRHTYLSAILLFSAQVSAADCAGLLKLSLPGTTLSTAETVPAGAFTPPAGGALSDLPEFCRVAGVIRPSPDSEIQFEVWMPAANWNQKFQGIGNGGFAGAISYSGLADAIRYGYAAASTDTGHKGIGTDAAWALGHPEKIVDFGHRAIHETAVQGKAVVKSYYGSAPKRSYFSSCSNGGRQALMEAQRYPEDYDGIIAGAPANDWIHLLTMAARNLKVTAGDSYIPQSKLAAIQAAAAKACDASDGVSDGVLENPAECQFDPGAMACKAGDSGDCLTELQVKALRAIYGGLKDSKGKILYPGYSPGGEAETGGWGPWITGKAQDTSLLYLFGTGFFRNMLMNDPSWDYRNFDQERDLKLASEKMGPILNATNPDLSRFQSRGGKLILYHGWCDAAIPAQAVIDYYQSVRAKMGPAKVDTFVRLYMAPGVQHCAGGAGPSAFGQGGVARGDARTNIAAALERWVEQGTPPAEIIAVKSAPPPSKEVLRSRPLCPYPMVAKYRGTGSTDSEQSFVCAASARASR